MNFAFIILEYKNEIIFRLLLSEETSFGIFSNFLFYHQVDSFRTITNTKSFLYFNLVLIRIGTQISSVIPG